MKKLNNIIMLLAVFIVSTYASAAEFGSEKVELQSQGGNVKTIAVELQAEGAIAVQYSINFNPEEFKAGDLTKCMIAVPDSFKGQFSSCKIVDKGRIHVAISNLSGTETLQSGLIGSIELVQIGKNRGLKSFSVNVTNIELVDANAKSVNVKGSGISLISI